MSQCPVCQQSLDDNFGMVVCPSCGTAMFIGMDGVPQVGEPNNEESMGQVPQNGDFQNDEFQSHEQALELQAVETNNLEDQEKTDFRLDENLNQGFEALPLEGQGQSDFVEPIYEEVAEENLFDPNAFLKQQSALSDEIKVENSISEIAEFGNDEVNSHFLYTLEISGIDSREIRSQLIEELKDKKFGFELQVLEKKIKEGSLVIEKINATSTAVLVRRLRFLNLDLKWSKND